MKALSTFFPAKMAAPLLTCFLLSHVVTNLQAQCSNAPTLTFHSPVLIAGTDGLVGAVYNFAQVAPGMDAHIEIVALVGGATLYNIDDSAGIGYYDAFQPYVGAPAIDTSYIDWRIVFKIAGTNTDTTLPCLAVTGIDIDGDGSGLKEFIEAATPGSFSVDPFTNLTVSFDGVRSKAISPVANIPMIDTNHLEAMFQMNFTNINKLDYRNGAIGGTGQVRQTCIYFKPFFQTYFMLPLNLLSFSAREINQTVEVKWAATGEDNLKQYTLQRSENGKLWINIGNVPVRSAGSVNNYVITDFTEISGTAYYRLMEIGLNGHTYYSPVVKIQSGNHDKVSFHHNTLFNRSIILQSTGTKNEVCSIVVYSVTGALLLHQKLMLNEGTSNRVIDINTAAAPGLYVLVIKNSNGQELYRSKLVKVH